MKKLIILLCLFNTVTYAQTTDLIKTTDTLYIYFDHNKGQEKFRYQPKGNIYYIYFNENERSNISFVTTGYEFPEVRQEKKCFLRRKKSKIITAVSLRNYEIKKAIGMIENSVIYIIDVEDFKKGIIILRQVRTATTVKDSVK